MFTRAVYVITGVLAHILVVYYGWLGLTHPEATAWNLTLGSIFGFLAVDLYTLLIHFAFDNYFSPTTPIIGKSVYYFREHHNDWDVMFERDYFANNFENAAFAAAWGLGFLMLEPGPLACMYLSVGMLCGAYVSQIHKWAHAERVPRLIGWMQRARIIVDPAFHDAHHDQARGNYGLFAAWFDPLFERFRVFEALEYLIYLLTGEVALESRTGLPRDRATPRQRYERVYWHAWYSFLSWYADVTGAHFTCMNWGYDAPGLTLDVGPERYPLQLYHHLASGIDLGGLRLVDASAGRGGGLRYLHETFGTASALGVDFTPAHTALCQRIHGEVEGLTFVSGNAEHLPLAPGSCDVIISVEASHCYADRARFAGSAWEALAPGGWLLWTDFAPKTEQPALRKALRELGFELDSDEDITPNILSAMRLDAARREALIVEHSAAVLRPIMRTFAASDERADTVQRFVRGDAVYFLWRLRKP